MLELYRINLDGRMPSRQKRYMGHDAVDRHNILILYVEYETEITVKDKFSFSLKWPKGLRAFKTTCTSMKPKP